MHPLQKYRLIAYKTKAEAAELIGVSQKTYSTWEKTGKLPESKVQKISQEFDCTPDKILGKREEINIFSDGSKELSHFGEVAFISPTSNISLLQFQKV